MSKSIVHNSITDIEAAKEKACMAARKVLEEKHAHGLPINPRHIAETYGIKVSAELLDEGIISVLVANKDRAAIGFNRRCSLTRQNFTIAHSLGHFIMHVPRNRSPSIYVEYDYNISDAPIAEMESNTFAMELLIPKKALDSYLQTFNVRYNNTEQLQKAADQFGIDLPLLITRMIDCKYEPY